jgi:glycosyltransferase involved in cell wall biosynthesis
MRILLVTESYWPNADGGALFERRLVKGLIAKGNELSVWAPSKRFRNYVEQDGNYKIFREQAVTMPFNKKYKVSIFPWLHTRRIFKATNPDVVHIHNPALLGRTAIKYANRHNIPVLATNHLMPENVLLNIKGSSWYYAWFYKKFWNYLVRFHNRAQFVTTPTPTALKFLKKYGLKTQSMAVTNGIDTSVFKSRSKNSKIAQKYQIKNKPTILYLGRVDGEKRIDIIIKATANLIKSTDCQLVIAGFGNAMDDLRKLSASLGIDDKVVFTGFIEEEDKPAIYNLCDLFVISSPAELQSIVTLEAMACAKPIVAVDVAALHELVHNGENGYLFKEDDSNELSEKLKKLLSSKSLMQKFGKKSLDIIIKNHTTKITFDTYENILEKISK